MPKPGFFLIFILMGVLFPLGFLYPTVTGDLARHQALTMDSYLTIGLVLVIAGPLDFFLIKNFIEAVRAAVLLKAGQPALATVLEVQPTGWTINNSEYQMRVKLQVLAPGMPPYEARAITSISRYGTDRLAPGMQLRVRYDPDRPQHVAVEGPAAAVQTGVAPAGEEVTLPDGRKVSLLRGSSVTINGQQAGELPANLQQLVNSVMADADQDGTPDILQQAGASTHTQVVDLRPGGSHANPQARLEILNSLRSAGLINEEEYQRKRDQILKEL